jgi:hypothetical protein
VATAVKKSYKIEVKPELQDVCNQLIAILEAYESKLSLTPYDARTYCLETKSPSYKGKPQFFGGVRTYDTYIGYYFMPVYMFPELTKTMSPQLKKRKQGKSCFNFRKVDPELFAELKKLTKAGFERFKAEKLL